MRKKNTPQNIAVIGAGIIGLMNAYELARRAHTVTLYDPSGFPAQNSASFIAGGMLAPYSEIEHMTNAFITAGLDSIALWQDILPALPKAVSFAQNGSLLIAHNDDRYMLERFKTHLPPQAGQSLSSTKMQELEPQVAEKFLTGLLLAEEAHIHPTEAMQALCKVLKEMDNITLIQERANPDALATRFESIIDCRGYNAKNTDTELRAVKGEIAFVENKSFNLNRPIRLMHPRYPLYIVPRPNNMFMIGATQIETAGDERVSVRSGLELLSALYSLHPSFGDAHIIALQAGLRPAYADNLPRIKHCKNIIACNGLFRHGFLLAPIMAKTVADIIEQKNNATASLFTKDMSEEKAP